MEFLLPVYLKFFPNALPSTFAHKSKEDGKKETKMKNDYQVASILRNVLLEHASGLGKEGYIDFLNFMEKVRSSHTEQPSSEEVLKFATLFENDLTLNSLNRINLICLCELLDLPTIGPNMMLRGLIQSRIRRLETDDRLILRDGIDSLNTVELQKACRARGMVCFGVEEDRMKFQLKQWTEFSLNKKVPITLLLLSRAFFYAEPPVPDFLRMKPTVAEELSVEVAKEHESADLLKGVIQNLPIDVEQATAWRLAELAGERIPNKERLLAVKREDDAIKNEQADAEEVPTTIDTPIHASETEDDGSQQQQPEHPSVTDQLANAIIELAHKKNIDLSTVEINDFVEDTDSKQTTLVDKSNSRADINVEENKTKKVLSKKIERMLNNVNRIHAELKQKRSTIQENIKVSESVAASQNDIDEPTTLSDDQIPLIQESIRNKRQNIVDLDEILEVIERLKPDHTTSPTELKDAVVQKLADKDNKIDVLELFKVLQYMSREHIELSKETLEEVSETIAAENDSENDIVTEENKK